MYILCLLQYNSEIETLNALEKLTNYRMLIISKNIIQILLLSTSVKFIRHYVITVPIVKS